MRRLLIIVGLVGLLALGTYACNEPSSGRSSTSSRKAHAPKEKQITNFNQSTQKDRRITGGPPADRTISGLDGLKLEAPGEKQISGFNQSVQKDHRITGGPPADRTISGLDGLKVD